MNELKNYKCEAAFAAFFIHLKQSLFSTVILIIIFMQCWLSDHRKILIILESSLKRWKFFDFRFDLICVIYSRELGTIFEYLEMIKN
jgi:hypothetical protein